MYIYIYVVSTVQKTAREKIPRFANKKFRRSWRFALRPPRRPRRSWRTRKRCRRLRTSVCAALSKTNFFAKVPNAKQFSQTNFLGEFCGGFFFCVNFGTFFLEKPRGNPQQNSKQNLGASRPKSTLQGSALDLLWNEKPYRSFSHRSFLVDVRAASPCQSASIWRA